MVLNGGMIFFSTAFQEEKFLWVVVFTKYVSEIICLIQICVCIDKEKERERMNSLLLRVNLLN